MVADCLCQRIVIVFHEHCVKELNSEIEDRDLEISKAWREYERVWED